MEPVARRPAREVFEAPLGDVMVMPLAVLAAVGLCIAVLEIYHPWAWLLKAAGFAALAAAVVAVVLWVYAHRLIVDERALRLESPLRTRIVPLARIESLEMVTFRRSAWFRDDAARLIVHLRGEGRISLGEFWRSAHEIYVAISTRLRAPVPAREISGHPPAHLGGMDV